MQGHTPRAVLIIESLMRYRILGRAASQETDIIKNILGPAPLLGTYTYGQFYKHPLQQLKSKSLLQNGSIILLAVG